MMFYFLRRVCLVFVLSCPLIASAVDELMSPSLLLKKPTEQFLLGGTTFKNGLIAVGHRGVIVRSRDGKTWQQAHVPVSSTLTAVVMASDHVGYAVGNNGVVIKTQNGGQDWHVVLEGGQANRLLIEALSSKINHTSQQKDRTVLQNRLDDLRAGMSVGASPPFFDVKFFDERRGFIVGGFGYLFRTDDGGVTWQALAQNMPNAESTHLYAIMLRSSQQVYVVGENGHVYFSNDLGLSWQQHSVSKAGNLFGVMSLPLTAGLFVFGSAGQAFIAKKWDGPWLPIKLPVDSAVLSGVSTADGRIIVSTADGLLLVSRDQGLSFDKVVAPLHNAITAILTVGNEVLVTSQRGLRRMKWLDAVSPL